MAVRRRPIANLERDAGDRAAVVDRRDVDGEDAVRVRARDRGVARNHAPPDHPPVIGRVSRRSDYLVTWRSG
jgi:hypothetical protein